MACAICGQATKAERRTCSKACRYALVSLKNRGRKPAPMSDEARTAASERMKGAGSPKWNGGRTTAGNGEYVLVTAPPDWPWPDMVDRRGYIREHRMVMARHLGRALTADEVVHHGPGGRQDNRIENLTLHGRHADHMADHWQEGAYTHRWPPCVFGCGRQSKPLRGVHFKACARCRRLAKHRGDPLATALH